MAAKKYWYITQTNLIDHLSEVELQMMSGSCIFKSFQKKDLIFSPDDPAQRIYILMKGTVTLYKLSTEGKRVVLDILMPITLFGDVSFLYDTVQEHYAEASSDVELCVVPKEAFLQIIERRPELALKLLEITSFRLREAESKLKDLAISDAKLRVTNQLIRLAEKEKEKGKDSVGVVTMHITHETLASMVGLTRETTTKVLNELEHRGVIHRDSDQRIEIDLERAQDLNKVN